MNTQMQIHKNNSKSFASDAKVRLAAWPDRWAAIREKGKVVEFLCNLTPIGPYYTIVWKIQSVKCLKTSRLNKREHVGARIQSGDHTEGYEMCGCVCGGGYCGEIRIRVETNTHPYEGKYCLPGRREICVGQYPQYIHYARRPHLFFLGGIKGTLAIVIIITTSFEATHAFLQAEYFSPFESRFCKSEKYYSATIVV